MHGQGRHTNPPRQTRWREQINSSTLSSAIPQSDAWCVKVNSSFGGKLYVNHINLFLKVTGSNVVLRVGGREHFHTGNVKIRLELGRQGGLEFVPRMHLVPFPEVTLTALLRTFEESPAKVDVGT